MKTKVPICDKCGKKLKGRIPIDATNIICFFCANPPFEDEEQGLKWADKRE